MPGGKVLRRRLQVGVIDPFPPDIDQVPSPVSGHFLHPAPLDQNDDLGGRKVAVCRNCVVERRGFEPMPLADALAGMRHFCIERDYLLRDSAAGLSIDFINRDALFGPWRTTASITGPRRTARTAVRCASRGFSRNLCRQAVRGWRVNLAPNRRTAAPDVKLPFAMTGPKTTGARPCSRWQRSSPTSCGSSRNCGRRVTSTA